MSLIAAGVDAKEHPVPKVELWHGGATRVSDPDPVLLRYTVTGGAVAGYDSRIACNSIELMKTPAQVRVPCWRKAFVYVDCYRRKSAWIHTLNEDPVAGQIRFPLQGHTG